MRPVRAGRTRTRVASASADARRLPSRRRPHRHLRCRRRRAPLYRRRPRAHSAAVAARSDRCVARRALPQPARCGQRARLRARASRAGAVDATERRSRGDESARHGVLYATTAPRGVPQRRRAPAWFTPNFAYDGGALVARFDETADGIDGRRLSTFATARPAGIPADASCSPPECLGSARIVLRSNGADARLPLLCNDYTYVPSLVPARLGRSMPEHAQSLTQLALFHERASADIAVGTIFSYRSLLLFRLLREMPLGVRDARTLMQYLLSGFIIAGFDHPQDRSEGKHVWREPDRSSPTGDRLAIAYELTEAERRDHRARERGFASVLRTLGAWPIRRVHPPLGSSLHYAGTLPFAQDERPFTLAPDGRLHGARNVFVADASGFTFLPAKPVTLSLMANAHRVAAGIAARR